MRKPLFFVLAVASLALATAACSADAEDDNAVLGEGEDELTAKKGQMCGGFAGTRCDEGLRCNYNRGLNTGTCVDDPNAASQGATEGETCGGTARIKCKTGLTCKTTSTRSNAKGKCIAAPVTCQAIPTCDTGHSAVASASDCLQDDAECYKRSMCGRTIWCTGPSSPPPGGGGGGGGGAGAGEMCGGFAGTPCRAGLRCDNSLGLNTGRCR